MWAPSDWKAVAARNRPVAGKRRACLSAGFRVQFERCMHCGRTEKGAGSRPRPITVTACV